MPDYDLSIRFSSKDEITPALKRMSLTSKMFGKGMVSDFSRVSKSALGLKHIIGGILGASAIQRGLGMMTMGVRGLTTEFLDFDQAITGAAAKWGIERGTDAFRELGTVARDVAKVTPYSAAQAGQGLDYLAMAGFDAKQAMAALPGVTELAISSNTELAEASDIASDALSSLGMMVKDDTQLKENLSRVNDVFAKTTITSNTNLQMLFESMKLVAPVATGLGSDVEELSAMLGTLANSGIKASMSGTALRNMYLRLTGGTREVTKVLEKYHIEVSKDGKMRSMIDILEDIKTKTAGLNDEQRQAAYTNLFGARAIASASVLMKAGSDELHRYEKSLRDATGASKTLAEEMSKSWANRLKAMKSQLIELGLKVFDTFEKDIPKAFDAVEKWLSDFNGEDFKRWVIDVRNETKPLIDGLLGIGRGLSTIAGLFSNLGAGFDDVLTFFISFKMAAGAAALAAGAFNVAAWPITLTLGAIGTVAYQLYKNWDKITAYTKDVVIPTFQNFGSIIAGALVDLLKLIPGVAPLLKIYEKVSGTKLPSIGGSIAATEETAYRKSAIERLDAMLPSESKTVATGFQGMANPYSVAALSARYAPEKSTVEVNVSAPDGTTAAVKQGKGAPKIRANLGKQKRWPKARGLSSADLADIHGM